MNKLKTYHFYIGREHTLFNAYSYENALKRARKEAEAQKVDLGYIGWSYGDFGKIHYNEQ